MNLGEKLKQYREDKNFTQAYIAELLNVKPATVSKYELNQLEPNIEVLKKYGEIFKITLDELLREEDISLKLEDLNILEILKEQKDMKMKGNLYHNTQIAFTYNTNHIEGSTLTEEQTRFIFETNTILFEDKTIANVNDIFETVNHFMLIDYMIDNAKETLTEEMIKEFHRILKNGTSDSLKDWFAVGDYKKLSNTVGGLKTSSPKEVQKHMQKLLEWYNSIENVTIKDIIEFHAKFEKIHPFQDGNGRIGRLIAFKECLKNNIMPFIILDKDKLFYYRGLKEYQSGGEKGFLIDTCLNAQDQYEKMVKEYLL